MVTAKGKKPDQIENFGAIYGLLLFTALGVLMMFNLRIHDPYLIWYAEAIVFAEFFILNRITKHKKMTFNDTFALGFIVFSLPFVYLFMWVIREVPLILASCAMVSLMVAIVMKIGAREIKKTGKSKLIKQISAFSNIWISIILVTPVIVLYLFETVAEINPMIEIILGGLLLSPLLIMTFNDTNHKRR